MQWEDDGYCFVCGALNSHGLRIGFRETEKGVTAAFSADKRFQGYKEIVHGGILATLLDEASVKALLSRGIKAVTAEMVLRFKHPLLVGQHAVVDASIVGNRGRVYSVQAEIRGEGGHIIAFSRAKLVTEEKSREKV